MKAWFVGEAVHNREVAASVFAVSLGFEAYVPLDPVVRIIARKPTPITVPRYGAYIFVRFDRDNDPWPRLKERWDQLQYFKQILCNSDRSPSPVPDDAMEAIRGYRPAIAKPATPIVYQPGQRVTVILAPGVRKEAVFVEYCGNTPMVRTWIFGSEHTVPVTMAQIELLEMDADRRVG